MWRIVEVRAIMVGCVASDSCPGCHVTRTVRNEPSE